MVPCGEVPWKLRTEAVIVGLRCPDGMVRSRSTDHSVADQGFVASPGQEGKIVLHASQLTVLFPSLATLTLTHLVKICHQFAHTHTHTHTHKPCLVG